MKSQVRTCRAFAAVDDISLVRILLSGLAATRNSRFSEASLRPINLGSLAISCRDRNSRLHCRLYCANVLPRTRVRAAEDEQMEAWRIDP
jgi:hypothetical protein